MAPPILLPESYVFSIRDINLVEAMGHWISDGARYSGPNSLMHTHIQRRLKECKIYNTHEPLVLYRGIGGRQASRDIQRAHVSSFSCAATADPSAQAHASDHAPLFIAPNRITSWTHSLEMARVFAKRKNGLVLRMCLASPAAIEAAVLIDLNLSTVVGEDEVIVLPDVYAIEVIPTPDENEAMQVADAFALEQEQADENENEAASTLEAAHTAPTRTHTLAQSNPATAFAPIRKRALVTICDESEDEDAHAMHTSKRSRISAC
jgi:hypothetical protein